MLIGMKLYWVRIRDLLTLILSSMSNLQSGEDLFNSFVMQLQNREDIPENAYTCIISNYSFYKRVEEAIKWIELLQKRGFPVKYLFDNSVYIEIVI